MNRRKWPNANLRTVILPGRLSTPDEIVLAGVYLPSVEASYVTGTNLIFDGVQAPNKINEQLADRLAPAQFSKRLKGLCLGLMDTDHRLHRTERLIG